MNQLIVIPCNNPTLFSDNPQYILMEYDVQNFRKHMRKHIRTFQSLDKQHKHMHYLEIVDANPMWIRFYNRQLKYATMSEYHGDLYHAIFLGPCRLIITRLGFHWALHLNSETVTTVHIPFEDIFMCSSHNG